MARTLFGAAVLLATLCRAGASQQVPAVKEETAGLQKLATVTPAQALPIAMARVPNGVFQSAEIEQEGGKLVYSFDIKVPGKTGIEEVVVDAMTGKVVGVEHESPADETKEARSGTP